MTRNNQSSFARNPTGTYSDQHNSPDRYKPQPPQQQLAAKDLKVNKDENLKPAKATKQLSSVNNNQSKTTVKPALVGGKQQSDAKNNELIDVSPRNMAMYDPRSMMMGMYDPRMMSNQGPDPRMMSNQGHMNGNPYGFLPYLPGYPFYQNGYVDALIVLI